MSKEQKGWIEGSTLTCSNGYDVRWIQSAEKSLQRLVARLIPHRIVNSLIIPLFVRKQLRFFKTTIQCSYFQTSPPIF